MISKRSEYHLVFRYKKAIKLNYKRQAYIFYHCLNYKNLSALQQNQINILSEQIGGVYSNALFDFMTKGANLTYIKSNYYGIYENGMNFYPLVWEFYERIDSLI